MSEYAPVNVVLLVDDNKDALLVNYGPTDHPQDHWFDESGPYASDCGFVRLPTEPGIYNCSVQPYWEPTAGDSDEGEMVFRVKSLQKIASLSQGVASLLPPRATVSKDSATVKAITLCWNWLNQIDPQVFDEWETEQEFYAVLEAVRLAAVEQTNAGISEWSGSI